jgi:three-Cys-motif partner protein
LDNPCDFFSQKRPWSKYKDLILDYYLEPYLNKVAKLGKPIVIVDCFAGPGKFDDGQLGSPLIISQKLLDLHQRGLPVKALYIEANPDLYAKLQKNSKGLTVPVQTRFGNFQDYLKEIFDLAKTHTTFIYVDPFKPTQFLFEDMALIYDQLYQGQSVEILINFMSANFLRIIWGAENNIISQNTIKIKHPQVLSLNKIAGGTYWQEIAFDKTLPKKEQVDKVANEYAKQLNKWFEWALTCPIRDKYHHKFPKYHLVFGSRHPNAVDLMNRAMVKARREFVGAMFVKGYLFENQPAKEVVNPDDIENLLIEVSQKLGRTTWQLLRVHATVNNPGMYTDSEFDTAIKKAIQKGCLKSDCQGNKIEQKAKIWF